MRFIGIWLLSVAAAVLYGILHDQITTRICVEYFTIAHPPVFATEDPTLLAFGWGTIATWWVGLGLGVPLSFVARAGARPKLGASDLVKPIGVLLLSMAIISLVAGLIGWWLTASGRIGIPRFWEQRIPAGKHTAFISVAWAHAAAYQAGFLGGLVLWIWTWLKRWQLARSGPDR